MVFKTLSRLAYRMKRSLQGKESGEVVKVREFSNSNPMDVFIQRNSLYQTCNLPSSVTFRTPLGKEITVYSPVENVSIDGEQNRAFKQYELGDKFP